MLGISGFATRLACCRSHREVDNDRVFQELTGRHLKEPRLRLDKVPVGHVRSRTKGVTDNGTTPRRDRDLHALGAAWLSGNCERSRSIDGEAKLLCLASSYEVDQFRLTRSSVDLSNAFQSEIDVCPPPP